MQHVLEMLNQYDSETERLLKCQALSPEDPAFGAFIRPDHHNLSENVEFSDIFYIIESLMWLQKAIFDNNRRGFPLRFPLIWAIWAD